MDWDDLSEDLAQILRLEAAGRDREASFVRDELHRAFPGHPQLVRGFTLRRAGPAATGAVAQPVHDRATESIVTFRPRIARRSLPSARKAATA